MTTFDIKANTFFKAIDLENQGSSINFHELKASPEDSDTLSTNKIVGLWINKEKPWSFCISTTFNENQTPNWDSLSVDSGVIFQIEFPFSANKEFFCLKDSAGNSVFKGPAKLVVYTKTSTNKVNKANFEALSSENTQNESFFPLPLYKARTDKSILEKKVGNKAIQNTKNLLFLRDLKDFLQKENYKVFLSLRGIGYRVFISDDQRNLNFKLGQTHPINVKLPTGISAISSTDRSATVGGGENQFLTLIGQDYQKLTQFAHLLVQLRPPEPYKGKGILIRTKKNDLRRQNLAKK